MNIKLPSFLKDLTDIIETSSATDELKMQYLNVIESGEVADEQLSLIKDLLALVTSEIKKREKQILISGDSQMLDQLTKNKKAMYDWQNEVEELALAEAEKLVEKANEDGFSDEILDGNIINEEVTIPSSTNSQEDQQDNNLPLTTGGII